jgi:hypothetical protein
MSVKHIFRTLPKVEIEVKEDGDIGAEAARQEAAEIAHDWTMQEIQFICEHCLLRTSRCNACLKTINLSGV